MHTKAEMLNIIKRYTKQYRVAFCDDVVILGYVERALHEVVNKLASGGDVRGHRLLLRYGNGLDIDVATEFYSLPSDCIMVDEVHIKGVSDDDWSIVPFVVDLDGAVDCGIKGVGCSSLWLGGCGLHGVFWGLDDNTGGIRIVGVDGLAGYKYRYRYLFRPVVPSVSGGTFNNPTGGATDIHSLPDAFCSCVEYLAASFLLMEDEENEKPIRNYGELFSMTFRNMVGVLRKKREPLYFGSRI